MSDHKCKWCPGVCLGHTADFIKSYPNRRYLTKFDFLIEFKNGMQMCCKRFLARKTICGAKPFYLVGDPYKQTCKSCGPYRDSNHEHALQPIINNYKKLIQEQTTTTTQLVKNAMTMAPTSLLDLKEVELIINSCQLLPKVLVTSVVQYASSRLEIFVASWSITSPFANNNVFLSYPAHAYVIRVADNDGKWYYCETSNELRKLVFAHFGYKEFYFHGRKLKSLFFSDDRYGLNKLDMIVPRMWKSAIKDYFEIPPLCNGLPRPLGPYIERTRCGDEIVNVVHKRKWRVLCV